MYPHTQSYLFHSHPGLYLRRHAQKILQTSIRATPRQPFQPCPFTQIFLCPIYDYLTPKLPCTRTQPCQWYTPVAYPVVEWRNKSMCILEILCKPTTNICMFTFKIPLKSSMHSGHILSKHSNTPNNPNLPLSLCRIIMSQLHFE